MVIVAVLLIFINNFAVSPLTNNAELMGEPLNILEPFIAVANSEILILIIPIVFLTSLLIIRKLTPIPCFISFVSAGRTGLWGRS